MKELSIEEKAKEFDASLKRAKTLIETCDSTAVVGWCEYIFPMLKEPKAEDEKIRKEIIDFLWKEKIFLQEIHLSVENSPKYRFVMDAIAWLEKQGEQSSAKTCKDAWSEEDKNLLKKAIKLLDEFGGDRNDGAYTLQQMSCRDCADWLKSLKQRLQ